MKKIRKRFGSVLLALCMVLAMLPTMAFAADASVDITGKSETGIASEIQAAIDAAATGNTVTVTGTVTDASSTLTLDIDSGVTVIWKASITAAENFEKCLVDLNGDGCFEVPEDGMVKGTMSAAISFSDCCNVTISGGTVSSNSGNAIMASSSGNLTVSGGTVSSTSHSAIVLENSNIDVMVSGGTVSSNSGIAICSDYPKIDMTVSGGTVTTTTGTAIKVFGSSLTISGGTVSATGKSSTAICFTYNYNASDITICDNGAVKATGKFSDAIVADNSSVQVKDEAVVSADGIAIQTSGDVTISGGTVGSSFQYAINGTGTGNVTVSGGTVSNSSGSSTYPVIYMSNVPAENKATGNVVVSGTGTVQAYLNGGGTAIRTSGNVTISQNAQVIATTGYAIHTEGETSNVTVSGGKVIATTGYAVYGSGTSATLVVSGGYVFAYGHASSGENNPIYLEKSNSFVGPIKDGLAIAWDKAQGTMRYDKYSTVDLSFLPVGVGTVTWANQGNESGISYKNNTNTGFIKVPGVTVTKTPILCEPQTYQLASNYPKTYSFDLTYLFPESVDASQVSAYTFIENTNANNIFNVPPFVNGSTLTLNVYSVPEGLSETVKIGFTSEKYDISNATITVEIVDKTLVTITANMTGGVYNGQPYAYSDAVVSSSVDNSDVTDSVTLEANYVGINGTTYGPSADAPKKAGSYQLTLSTPASNANYVGDATFPFTIEKRPLTIKADNKSMTVGGKLPKLTYTREGQLPGETAQLGSVGVYVTDDWSKVGSYEITVNLSEMTYTANYKAADPAYVNGTLTVSNPSTGGDTPSGGGSSAPAAPAPTVSGATATTTTTAKTGSDGKATASVTQLQMSTAITTAQKAAASTGEAPHVEIQVSGASGASTVETTLPKTAVQALVTGKMKTLTLSSNVADITFDAQAIAAIAGAASGDVNISAAQVENSTLSDAAAQVVGNRPVYSFSVTSGGSTISEFGGAVTVSVPYNPAVGEDTNAIVAYYINAKGEPELMQNCHYDAGTKTLVFTTTHFSQYAVGYHKVTFTDVSGTAWYADAVTFLASRGITGGTSETTFSPDATLTRGQFITLLLRAYGIDADSSTANNFADAGNTYYTGYLAAAKRLGISNGVGDNKFAPEQAITRQEMFTLLYNALKAIDQLPEDDSGKTLSDFTDSANISSYAQEAMAYLVKTGVVGGSNGQLSSTDTTTRAQMAQVLYNLLGK